MTFATSLLCKYRKYLNEISQRKNNLPGKDFEEPTRNYENNNVLKENKTYKQLQMIDEVTNKDYLLNVPEDMYEHAMKGNFLFLQQLINTYICFFFIYR